MAKLSTSYQQDKNNLSTTLISSRMKKNLVNISFIIGSCICKCMQCMDIGLVDMADKRRNSNVFRVLSLFSMQIVHNLLIIEKPKSPIDHPIDDYIYISHSHTYT